MSGDSPEQHESPAPPAPPVSPGPPDSEETVLQTIPSDDRTFLELSAPARLAGLLWAIVWHALFRFTPPPFYRWRCFMLRLFRAKVDMSARIAPSVRIDFPWNLTVGPGVRIQHKVIINCMGTIEVGENSFVSQYAHLCAGTHDYQHKGMRIVRCPVKIGRDVWVAADAFVGPDVTLGDECLLAARSSAFHDLPPGKVCIGEPAEPRYDRFDRRKEEKKKL